MIKSSNKMSATKRIAKNFSWLFIGSIVSGTLNFLLTIYLARVLHAAVYGLYSFVQAFFVYLVLFMDAGLPLLGTQEIARDRDKFGPLAINILAIRLVVACSIYIISAAIIIFSRMDSNLRWLFLSVFLLIFYRALIVDWLFQGIEKMEYMALARVAYAAATFGLIILIVRKPEDLLFAPLIQFVIGVLVSLSLLVVLFKRFLKIDLKFIALRTWPQIYLRALPLGAALILLQIYTNLDVIMLGFFDTKEVVGYYNAAYQLLNIMIASFAAWQAAVLPTAVRRLNSDLSAAKLFIDKYLRLSILIFVPLIVIVFILAPSLVAWLYGAEYAPAASALRYLIWVMVSIVIGSVHGITILIAAGKYNIFLKGALIGALVNIVLNFVLIPQYSFAGAAVATIIAEISAASYSIFYGRKIVKVAVLSGLWRPLLMVVPAMLAAWLAAFWVNNPFVAPYLESLVFVFVYALVVCLVEKEFIFSFIKELIKKT
ncbi:flippase [Candidatus Saganbacteria bacterium]|nr:flippase [Candidatus Saganbacteria bacterium]